MPPYTEQHAAMTVTVRTYISCARALLYVRRRDKGLTHDAALHRAAAP